MTNFEKVKAMTPEEMAEFFEDCDNTILLAPCDERYCDKYDDTTDCARHADCVAAMQKWLESEAE